MTRFWPLIPAVCLLAAAAAAHGLRTDRWGPSPDLRAAAARLADLPAAGDWEGAVVETDPAQAAATHAAGIASRRYTHRYTRAEVDVLVLCGRPGPVCVHTPDVCYTAAGYTMGEARSRDAGAGDTAWVADFRKPGPTPETLRISWAWSDGGAWTAAASPRTEFARARVLYKLYVVRRVPPGEDPAAGPDADLMKHLLPALRAHLAESR